MKLSGIPQVSQFEHHKKEPAIAASNIIKIDSSSQIQYQEAFKALI